MTEPAKENPEDQKRKLKHKEYGYIITLNTSKIPENAQDIQNLSIAGIWKIHD